MSEVDGVKKILVGLDERLAAGSISESTYKRLKEKWEARLKNLQSRIPERSSTSTSDLILKEALEKVDLWIVNVEGHLFDPGMAATPLNIEEFDANDTLMVDQMIEPIIMGKEGLIKTGTVTLRKITL